MEPYAVEPGYCPRSRPGYAHRGGAAKLADDSPIELHEIEGENILVVPRKPGPLVDPEQSVRQRAPDEIDEVIDELFGPEPATTPGWADAAFFVGGVALIVWARIALHSSVVTVIGAILVCLGLVLPIRSAWRSSKRERARRRREAVMAGGFPVNVSHPLTHRLVDVYDELLRASESAGGSFAIQAMSAAHLALIESSTLLAGGVPATPAEVAYVERRIDAIDALADALRQAGVRSPAGEAGSDASDRILERVARARAGEELDALGVSSVNDLRDLAELMNKSRGASEG